MGVDLVERLVDVARLVGEDDELHVGGQVLLERDEFLFHALDHRDGVRAGLAADGEGDGGFAVQAREGALFLRAVLGRADVANADRRAAMIGDGDVIEVAWIGDAADGAERLLALRRGDVAAGAVRVLAHDGVAHGGDRDLVRGEFVVINPDVDGAVEAAVDLDFADAERTFEMNFYNFVGEFREFAQRARAGERDGDDRVLVVVEFGNDRRIGLAREVAQNRGDAVAHVLRGDVDVAFEREGGAHPGIARRGDRAKFFNARDGVKRFLDRLIDEGFDFLRRRAGQPRVDAHSGKIDRRKTIHTEAEITRGADDDERQHQHGGEDGALDANFRELLHGVSAPRRGLGRVGDCRGSG